MYIKKSKILFSNFLSVIFILVSGFFAFISLVGIFSAFAGEYTQSFGETISIFFTLLFLCIAIIWLSIRRISLANKANKFNSIFENDHDGVVDAEKTASLFALNEKNFIGLFDKLVKKGYLINCSLDFNDKLVIVLNNGGQTAQQRFDLAYCENCGASTSVKIGFVEKCPYCGSKLNVKDVNTK